MLFIAYIMMRRKVMRTMLEMLRPTVTRFPGNNCASGKESVRSGRTQSAAIGHRNGGVGQPVIPLAWVTLQMYAASSGYSVGALRQKMRRGQFIEGKHFRKAPDGRVLLNIGACQSWGLE